MKIYMAKESAGCSAFCAFVGSNAMPLRSSGRHRALAGISVFPYEEGLEWATDFIRREAGSAGGAGVPTLPESTEQILAPGEIFAHEARVKN